MQFVVLVVGSNYSEVEDYAEGIDGDASPEGGMVSEMLRDGAAGKHAHTHAQIPAGKNGGVGGAALAMGCHVDEYHLESGPQMPVAQANDKRCNIIAGGMVYGCKENEAADRNQDTQGGIAQNESLAQGAAPREARDNQADSKESEEEACARGDTQLVAPVDSHVGGNHAVRKAHGEDGEHRNKPFEHDESVERKGLLIQHQRAVFHANSAYHDNPQHRHGECQPKQHLITLIACEEEHRNARADGGGDIVAQPEISHPFGSTRRRKHIHRYGRERHARSTKRCAMQHTKCRKHREAARQQVAAEERCHEEVENEQHHLAGETVHKETAERAYQQRRQGIAGEDNAYHLLIRRIGIAQVERQEGSEQHEGKVHKEIARPHLNIVAVPKFLFHRWSLSVMQSATWRPHLLELHIGQFLFLVERF